MLSAIEARKRGKDRPDIYVFRYTEAPAPSLDDPRYAEVVSHWSQLKAFFESWFKTKDGQYLAASQSFHSTDDFASQIDDCLRQWLARNNYVKQAPKWDRGLRGSPFSGPRRLRGGARARLLRPRPRHRTGPFILHGAKCRLYYRPLSNSGVRKLHRDP